MSGQAMPHRQPVSDAIEGAVTRLGDDCLLSAAILTRGELVAAGELVVRYGIPYSGKPFQAIVPDLVVLDYGDMLTGEDAWAFLVGRSHLHPRADVLGYDDDGIDQMLMVRQLDLGMSPAVFVYRQESDRQPLARLAALIAANPDAFPQRLRRHLPTFASFADWQAR